MKLKNFHCIEIVNCIYFNPQTEQLWIREK